MKIELKKITEILEIKQVLKQFNTSFPITLNESVGKINQFAQKLSINAEVIILISEKKNIVGFEAFYVNNTKTKEAFLSLIGIKEQYRGSNYADILLSKCIDICLEKGMLRLKLEVSKENKRAIAFYKKKNFAFLDEETSTSYYMIKKLNEF